MINLQVVVDEFSIDKMITDILKDVDGRVEMIERESETIVRNGAERAKERILLRLEQRKALDSRDMRNIRIETSMEGDTRVAYLLGSEKIIHLDAGTKPHRIPKSARTKAYAKHYGLTFKQFAGGIFRKGTKGVPILDYARVLAERQMDRDIDEVFDNL